MQIVTFTDQCHNASTEALYRSYKSLRQQEIATKEKLECIRKELIQRGFLPPTERLLDFWEKAHAPR